MKPYVSASGEAQLIDTLLAAQLGLWGLRLGGWLVVALSPASPLAAMFERGAAASAPFTWLLLTATVLAFYAWLLRAAANLEPLTGRPMPRALLARALLVPAWARRLLWKVWQTSDPVPPPARQARWWWTALWGGLGGALLLELVQRAYEVAPPMHGRSDGVTLVATQALLAVVAARTAVALVRDVQRRQDQQHDDRVRRDELPRPTADRLR
jgi:hypothetical protein